MIPIICNFLYFLIFPSVLFYYYSRCCFITFRWHRCLVYSAVAIGIGMLELSGISGIMLITLKILFLALCGVLLLKQKGIKSIILASLMISILSLTDGLTRSLSFWIVSSLPPQSYVLLKYMDIAEISLSVTFFTITFWVILKFFADWMKILNQTVLLLLAIPLFFIALTEEIVSVYLYGDTVIWDNLNGLTFPLLNNAELTILHLFAYIGMWSILFVFQKTYRSIQSEQIINLLNTQAQEQETYVRETQTRYDQTRSFRHDIKNHFIVLKELLANNEVEKAHAYLCKLDQTSTSLSYPIHTGHLFVDVLLGSKLKIAEENQIQIKCKMEIPPICIIEDIDWCILLSNAIDNAINANLVIASDKRYLYIHSRLKSNLFVLHIENSCEADTRYPVFGIGFTNIAAVIEKYKGAMEIETSDGVFKIDVLFAISQH